MGNIFKVSGICLSYERTVIWNVQDLRERFVQFEFLYKVCSIKPKVSNLGEKNYMYWDTLIQVFLRLVLYKSKQDI